MSEYGNTSVYQNQGESLRTYVLKVFTRMGLGLLVTAATAFACYLNILNGGFILSLLSNMLFVMVLLVAEIGVGIAFLAGINRFSAGTCTVLMYAYAVLTGVTFSVLPASFGVDTIFTAFLFAAVLFGCCVVIGYTTNVDLTRFAGIAMAALITLVIVSVLSVFISALRDNLIVSYLGVIVFLFYTAYDMQKVKTVYYNYQGTEMAEKASIYGSFQLYLDFINLFIYILRIVARSSRD